MYKMKNKMYHTISTVPKLNSDITERGQLDTINTHKHDRVLSWHRVMSCMPDVSRLSNRELVLKRMANVDINTMC
jgi:hypothetical protein